MSYRGGRHRARQEETKIPETTFKPPRQNPGKAANASENSEGNKLIGQEKSYKSRQFPKLDKEIPRNIPGDVNTRTPRVTETKIPVAKRVRVPNTYADEDRVTPVRERFRARHEDVQGKPRNDFHRFKINDSKRVTFYRNGDKHFKGRTLFITKQRYRSFESILEELSRIIPLPYGVRNILSSNGRSINSINELEDGQFYVCSSGDQLIRNIDYEKIGKTLNKSDNDLPEAIQNIAISAPSDSSSTSSNSRSKNTKAKPKIITIINQERSLKSKILLNRKTAKNYEDILRDISDMMQLQDERVRELISESGSKVGGLSEMFYGGDVYTAVITADLLSSKRNLSNPSSHSSNGLDRLSPSSDRQHRKSRKKRRDLDTHEEGVAIKVKGRKHVFYPPSKRNSFILDESELASAPSSRPQLNWVYGYQGKDTHHNLHVLPSGELLYFVSRIVVIYNRKNNTQRHYTAHADDIKCMAVHPNQWYIATGQVSGLSLDHNELSHIRIWDSETLLTLNVLQLDDYSLSVVAMQFSIEDNGDILSGIDSSGDNYRLNIWEWKDSKCLIQSKGFVTPVSAVMFDPDDSKTIISCGREHIYFWRWHNGKLERKNGLFENNPFPQYITCMDFASNGDIYTGDSNGSITSWSKVSKKIKFMVRSAHEKSILCLRVLESGILLTAGGVDGRICAWDSTKYFSMPLHEIQLPELTGISALEPLHSGVGNDVTLIVGTTTNSLLEGSLTGPFTSIVKGHKLDVPSLAVHPSRDVFVTASLDKTATLWSAVTKEMLWTANVEFSIRVAAFYTTGSVIAFGTTHGRWIVLNAESGVHQASFQDGTEPIADLEYSPDGEHIAIGSKDGNIYIHAVYDEGMTYRRVGCCSGHTLPVMFLDWSADGCFVQSMSSEYDIIIWEIGSFERENSQNIIRDTEWNTRNVVLGYDVAGVWRSTPTEGNLVTSSDLAWSHNLIAIGDELGYIRVFNYPCYYDESQYHQVRAHSSIVLRVMFMSSDKFLLSTAGNDCAVLQWTMEGKMTPKTKLAPQLLEVLSNSDEHTDQDMHDAEKMNNSSRKQEKMAKNYDRDQSDSGDLIPSEDYSNGETSESHDVRVPPRRRGRRDKAKPRRSFEQDMYQERDETSDERKKKIMRHSRATKRYEPDDDDDDDSTYDDSYDDDDMIDRRHVNKAKGSYQSRDVNDNDDGRMIDKRQIRKANNDYQSRDHDYDDGRMIDKRQIRKDYQSRDYDYDDGRMIDKRQLKKTNSSYQSRDDDYDDDDRMIDNRRIRKPNASYQPRGYARRPRSPEEDPKSKEKYKKSYVNNGNDDYGYSKRNGYSDAMRGYRRNKR